ncbi:MAG: PQQ-binding-like beta-propeller repeat protein [Planctomycetota bacterium]|nr:PQQ-binding-like beta-propeller repeat protein [Planctomycetota bacterium]
MIRVSLRRCSRSALVLALALHQFAVALAPAQQAVPVYVDDSIVARETLLRLDDLIATNNLGEAVRALQAVLDAEADRLLETLGSPDVFQDVRTRVHAAIIERPALLDRYIADQEPEANVMLRGGRHSEVERSRLLTPSGFEAALRVAQEHLVAARFEAARLVLAQLDAHPARVGKHARKDLAVQAATMARTLSKYVARAPLAQLAARWERDADIQAPASGPATFQVPASVSKPALSPIAAASSPGPALAPDLLDLEPDQPEPPTPSGVPEPPGEPAIDPLKGVWLLDPDASDPDEHRSPPEIYPTVAGDLVLINSGTELTARDRYTFELLWRLRHDNLARDGQPRLSSFERRRPPGIVEVNTVAAGDGVAVGVTTHPFNRESTRVHGVLISSGRTLWSVEPTSLDPQLDESAVRGSPVIHEGTVVVAFRKRAAARRTNTAYLAGLDLFSGNLRWLRLVATAGSLPSGGNDRPAGSMVAHQGVVYWFDDLGVCAAIQVASGRTVWMRRFQPQLSAIRNSNLARGIDGSNTPLIDDAGVLTILDALGDRILKLNAPDAAIISQRSGDDIGSPRYLLKAADRLIGVTESGVVSIAPDGTFIRSSEVRNQGGRAFLAGDRIIVPVATGLVSLLASDPRKDPQTFRLAHAGAAVATGDQVLVADHRRLYAYQSFETVERVLGERLARNPEDAGAAIALVEFAARTGRSERLITATDRALAIADRAKPTLAAHVRSRMFSLLLDWCERSLPSVEAGVAAGASGSPSEPGPSIEAPLVELVARLGRCVESPEQRAAQLLLAGRVYAARADWNAALESFQQVLIAPEVAQAYPSTRVPGAVRFQTGDELATRAVREVLRVAGVAAYAPFEAEVRRRLAELPQTATPEERARVARAYPAAASAADALLQAAESFGPRDALAQASALAHALDIRAALVDGGRSDLLPARYDAAIRYAEALQRSRRPEAALRVLTQHASPEGSLTALGVSPEQFARGRSLLAQARAAALDPARSAQTDVRGAQAVTSLEGWELIEPALPGPPRQEDVLLWNPSTRRLAGLRVSPRGDRLTLAWSRAFAGGSPVLLRHDLDAVLILVRSPQGTLVQRLSPADGSVAWQSQFLHEWLGDEDPARRRENERFLSPLDGLVQRSDLVVAATEDHLIIARRGQWVGAIDLATGATAWTRSTVLARIFDIAAHRSSVVAIGTLTDTPADEENSGLLVLDARTGEVRHEARLSAARGEAGALVGPVRWVRPMGDRFAAGGDNAVGCLDPATGQWCWLATDLPSSTDAWPILGKLLVLDRDGKLSALDAATGVRGEERMDANFQPGAPLDVRPVALGDQRQGYAVVSEGGVRVFDEQGGLIGSDPFAAELVMTTPEAGAGQFIAIERERQERAISQALADSASSVPVAHLLAFETPGGRLLAKTPVLARSDPTSLRVLHGMIVIGMDDQTMVITAPAGE